MEPVLTNSTPRPVHQSNRIHAIRHCNQSEVELGGDIYRLIQDMRPARRRRDFPRQDRRRSECFVQPRRLQTM